MTKVTVEHLQSMVEWTRSTNAKIKIYLEGTDKVVSIYKYIRVEDRDGRPIPWLQAFGARSPQAILSSYKISRIVVEEGGSQQVFDDVKKLLYRVGVKNIKP